MNVEEWTPARLAAMTIGDLIAAAERARATDGVTAAIALYESWLAINGDSHVAHLAYFNLGAAFNERGEALRATKALREGVRLKPDFAPLRLNLGRALETIGDPKAAIEQWRSGLETLIGVTGEAASHKSLLLTQTARLLQHHLKDELAEPLLVEAVNLDPHFEAAVREWTGLRTRACRWPAIEATTRVSAEVQRAFVWPLTLAAISDDPLFQLARAAKHARTEFPRPTRPERDAVAAARVPRSRRQKSKLKIGYVSSDLREHAVGHGIAQVFEGHDRERFDIFAYYCGVDRDDAIKQRIRRAATGWVDISAISDLEAAKRIAGDGVDILVDLNGYTKFARTPIFALRPAPVQVNWFGYPSTMGTPYHHYLIADETIVPPGDEMFYSEEVLRLPCYQPNDRNRAIAPTPRRAEFGLPDDAFVYCSFNATQKLTQRMFDLWLAILRASPNSVLWLMEGAAEANGRLIDYARGAGVAADRIVFARKLDNAEHLARYALADLFLDSFPWGAHTTASDALWMGAPILTLKGRTFAARVCSSLVMAAGLPELACDTEEDYVGKAVALAAHPQATARVRARLNEARDRATLFDMSKLTRGLEALYLDMARRAEEGRTPQPDLTNLEVYHQIGVKLDIEAANRLSREAYLRVYRDALADVDLHDPLPRDDRLWPGLALNPAQDRDAA